MHLNSRYRYAVLALIDLAMRQEKGHVALSGISRRLEISVSYLEMIFARLRHCGIVQAARGPGGGYCLTRPIDGVSVGDIIQAIDGGHVTAACDKDRACVEQSTRVDWVTQDLWANLNRKIMDHLHSVSLGDVIERVQVNHA